MLKKQKNIKKRLNRHFFARPTLEVCKDILGKYLVHKIGKKKLIGKIVEVEAYIGPKDKASHAVGGKMTKRNWAEFLEGGHVYIYLVYGMYWQFNISTGKKGSPECFLVRALEPIIENSKSYPGKYRDFSLASKIRNSKFGEEIKNLANGPGKLCQWMKLDKRHYGLDLTKSGELWIEDWGEKIPDSKIVRTKRIGIDYAGKYWSSRKWRFYIKDNKFVSRL
jgi:DNA-3-methyladenine glycosylase